jgi:endonuclease/exonuclease/phosphatase family metal-dependent hydrolase
MGHLMRLALALAVGLPLLACNFQDDLSPREWVPFQAITGPLAPELSNTVAATGPAGANLRLVTYNVHLGPDIPGLASAILQDPALMQADVFAFEEIESHPKDGRSQAAWLADLLGLNYAYAPAWAYDDGGTHGLAVLSRFPIGNPRVLELPHFDLVSNSERRIALGVQLAVGGRTLALVVVHLDTRINVNQRLQQLSPAIQKADPACILGGDFNSNPFVWVDRQIPLLPQQAAAPIDTAAAIDELMRSNGFATPTATSGDTTNAIANARLDSLYTRGYTPVQFGVERSVTVSDHFPVWLDVAWPPP